MSRRLQESVIYQLFLRSFTLDGTLRAAEKLLPHIASLGVDIVYLCPIVEADADADADHWSPRQKESKLGNPQNPYRISDFNKIDPEYGNDADLKSFVGAAHRLKLKVILDLVYYHCGGHAVFLKEHPDFVKRDDKGMIIYGTWHFPELNFESAGLREYLWQNMEHFIREHKVDGYRCDVSFGVPLDFWEEARRRLTPLAPDLIMVAESEKEPLAEQKYAFDVNYSFSFALMLDSVVKSEKPLGEFWRVWEEQTLNADPATHFLRSFDNHDIANDNYDHRPECNGHSHRADAALAVIFTLNGVPFLYNGQEIADGRRHSIWGNRHYGKNLVIDWAKALTPDGQGRLALIRELAQLRQKHPALTGGVTVKLDNDHPECVLSYLRKSAAETMRFAVNFGSETVTVKLDGDARPLILIPGGWVCHTV